MHAVLGVRSSRPSAHARKVAVAGGGEGAVEGAPAREDDPLEEARDGEDLLDEHAKGLLVRVQVDGDEHADECDAAHDEGVDDLPRVALVEGIVVGGVGRYDEDDHDGARGEASVRGEAALEACAWRGRAEGL